MILGILANVLMNRHIMDPGIVNNMIMAVVSVMVILSVVKYVMSANRPMWYDRVMIGGSVGIVLLRVCKIIQLYISVMDMVIIVMCLVMAISSIVVIVNDKSNNSKNDEYEENGKNNKDENEIAKSVIVLLIGCAIGLTGWVIQIQDMNVNIRKFVSWIMNSNMNTEYDERVDDILIVE